MLYQSGGLAVLNLVAPANGYMYIYVTNESAADVSFDNLKIIHHSGTLVQQDEYYPYGLLWNSNGINTPLANKYKYNGKE